MRVHQVRWSHTTKNVLYFNSLSCFECETKCSHYHIATVNYGPEDEVINQNPTNADAPTTSKSETPGHKNEQFENLNLSGSRVLKEPLVENDWVVVKYSRERIKKDKMAW